MKQRQSTILILLFLVLCVVSQETIRCFTQTEIYGTSSTLATKASDLSYLRSDGYQHSMTVYQIYVCGTLMAFEGIQLFLSDTDGTHETMSMN